MEPHSTSLTMMRILCFGPGELQPQLNAVMVDQLNYNILTQRGLRLLQGIKVNPRREQKFLIDRTGFEFAVRDVVDLQIWRDGDTRSVNQTFYVLMSDDTLRQGDLHERHLHVILSPNCFPPDSPDSEGDPVATLRVSNPGKTAEKQDQEQDKKQKRKNAENFEKRKREEDRTRAAQQTRNPKNDG
ncbi:uncharacterized protein KD926_010944 [Aspergillus affinis]|uniref:uncharacterized protein n=1 Tax=Aspergillus affinis TaxID=1070780 RepID=UPI0022FF4326|nr:uncharacterized protein KD926_010944 [Aspergillus affinis]KAI9038288.1 hypothetical protein KD926_010944 [Aspergillus affinis]